MTKLPKLPWIEELQTVLGLHEVRDNAAQRFAARTRAKLPSVVLRNDALVVALATQQGKTAEQLDDFFRTYAEI